MNEPVDDGAGEGRASPPVPARVEIAAGGRQVVVEAPESLTTVANTAMQVWRITDDPKLTLGFGSAGCISEQVSSPLPEDLTLPAHLTTVEPFDDEPRARRR